MSYLCLCGHVIKDTVYPCPESGDLKWDPESLSASEDALQSLKEFFVAVENGEKTEWLKNFFNIGESELAGEVIGPDGKRTTLPLNNDYFLNADMTKIIYDIFSRYERKEGHSVFRCPECERLYIQKEYRSDEYSRYEKRPDYSRA